MHRKDDERDEGERLAGPSPFVAGSDRRLNAVIPFPQSRSAAISASAAGGEPPSSPASFVSLGSATAAVVMRLSKKFPRIKVLTQTTREGET